MKYRIKKVVKGTSHTYIPQCRYKWIPLWFCYEELDSLAVEYKPVTFSSLTDAVEYLDKKSIQNYQRVEYINYPLNKRANSG